MPALEFFVPPGSAPGVTTRKLLRSTLAKHLASLGVSFESTVTLEYAIPVPPPRAGPSSQEDDWVAAIDGGERCVDGCALLHLHSMARSMRWNACCVCVRLHWFVTSPALALLCFLSVPAASLPAAPSTEPSL